MLLDAIDAKTPAQPSCLELSCQFTRRDRHLKQSMNELLAEQWRILFVGDPRVESCPHLDAKNRTHQVTPV